MRPDSATSGRFTAGVIVFAIVLSSALFVLGLAVFFLQGGATRPFQVRGFADVVAYAVRGTVHGEARGLIEAGLLVLLFAPFPRLVASVMDSAKRRNWRFVTIGTLVMLLLLAGILLGIR
jgi:uncharacterized membrane protein